MSKDSREQRRAQARAQREAAERAAAKAEQRRRRLQQLAGVVVAAVVVVVAVVLVAGGGSDDENAATSSTTVNATAEIREQLDGIPQDGFTLGEPDAPITIVEYGDLQCPACAAFSNTLMPRIVNDWVRTGKARFQFRNFPFLGEDSTRLAQMALALAEQDRMFDFIELVYANQGAENSGYATDDYLRRIASAIPGVDVERAMKARESDAVLDRLREDQGLAAGNGISATPTFLVGRSGQTPRPVDASQLEAALAQLDA
ncbi:MAG: thioredoxin domain-containing protein [Solirubrobacteraceae bacterium]|nr:thioredoxin domain-containing protein [Solirubrobacteraceae bacterium]